MRNITITVERWHNNIINCCRRQTDKKYICIKKNDDKRSLVPVADEFPKGAGYRMCAATKKIDRSRQ